MGAEAEVAEFNGIECSIEILFAAVNDVEVTAAYHEQQPSRLYHQGSCSQRWSARDLIVCSNLLKNMLTEALT